MLIAILSSFILSAILFFVGKFIKGKWSLMLTILPLFLFVYFFFLLSQGKEAYSFIYEWVPALGVDLVFRVDGLSLLFALMITGVGALVFAYTANYLKGHHYLDRFYAYLSIFMGAMLGLVFSDNLITLFIFWELTSISSFFLIGFNNQDSAARKSALMALGITGMGGLALLAAALLIGHVNGTYSIQALISDGSLLMESSLLVPIILLIFLAAFTKSAQFPFHFWLPGAMKAPTPVSTYLHSATMVKAGIYLLLRFSPAFGEVALWNNTLLVVGGITMLYAAIQTLFHTDLKSILAYSTISALGILTFLIGMGTEAAILAALTFIIVHALYKAALFLITGIIDHETGSRDASKLAGLGKFMLPVAIAGGIAALSNSGIPPTVGFLGKDLIYEAALGQTFLSAVFTAALVITNILLLYAGFVVGIKPFFGRTPPEFKKVKLPSPLLYIPPIILAVGSLAFGLFPSLLQNGILNSAQLAVVGSEIKSTLKLWHGFNLILLLSSITIGSGLLLYFLMSPTDSKLKFINKFKGISPKTIVEKLANLFAKLAGFYSNTLQNGYLRTYILIIMLYFIALIGYPMFSNIILELDYSELLKLTIYEVSIMAIMVISILVIVSTKSRLTTIVAMGVVGYSMCLLFVFYSAPDLAMTQFLIDTLTVILFVLVLYKLPLYLNLTGKRVKFRDGLVAISFGIIITFLALMVLNEPAQKEVGDFYASNAYTLAKGKNVVNVILVDFRGIDTFVEIIVLSIAAIGVFGLMKLHIRRKSSSE